MINFALYRSQWSQRIANTIFGRDPDLIQSTFHPYEDDYISMSENIYEDPRELPVEVNERALDKFVNKLIFNQAVTLPEGHEQAFHESTEDSPLHYKSAKIPGKFIGDTRKTPEDQLPKHRGVTSARKSRTRRPNDKSVGDDEIHFKDLHADTDITSKEGKTMVTMSIDMLRGYMYTEVEARIRYIHDFYERQWNIINREKMQLYTEMYEERNQARKMENEIARLQFYTDHHQRKLDDLSSKVNTSKEAKRRRRQAKKLRKQTTADAADPMSETNTVLGDGAGENVEPDTGYSQIMGHSSERGTSIVQDKVLPGGGDTGTGSGDKHKKAYTGIRDIDAEINALVL